MKTIITILGIFISIQAYTQEGTIKSFGDPSGIINDFCLTADGNSIAVTFKNEIQLYSLADRKLIKTFKNAHKKDILTIDVSKDNSLLISGGKDSLIVIWDFNSGDILQTLDYHKGIITSVDISPDNNYLATGSTDHKVYIYDLSKKEIFGENSFHTKDVLSVEFYPNNDVVASSSADKTVKLYSISEGKVVADLKRHKSWVRDISFSNDGKKLMSCDDKGNVLNWTVADFHKVRLLSTKKYGNSWILSNVFHNDNKTYIIGNRSGTVFIQTPLSLYEYKTKAMINKVLFIADTEKKLKAIVATRGRGIFELSANEMTLK